jgi:DNA-binding NarL/FixJ family response regulator
MSGRELADAVKELRPEVKVLFVSGYTDDVVIRRGGHDASSSFLQKPFSTDRLGQMVREVLDG